MTTVPSEASDCTAMIVFARAVSGRASVGLNAVELVSDKYR